MRSAIEPRRGSEQRRILEGLPRGSSLELGEIESVACATNGVMNAACVFEEDAQDIILVYTGEATEEHIKDTIKRKLMPYMLPSKYIHLDCMPMNINGKIDREKLREVYG